MFKKLIQYLENNFPKINIDDWLNSKYIQLSDSQLKKMAKAIQSKELEIKPIDKLPLERFIFHFSTTFILVQKKEDKFVAELAWQTDFLSVHSIKNKDKGFVFISFSFDKDYKFTLLEGNKNLEGNFVNEVESLKVVTKVTPILQGFISAIS
jgi:hypothetical protein